MAPETPLYQAAGVDAEGAQSGIDRIVERIRGTWPRAGQPHGVKLDIGYFANVIDIGGGVGLAISTDGVGTKSIVADMMKKYDTIGVDCVAMNVNDLICVGAKPLSLVDYIAVERADPAMLGAIGVGLAEGARQAGISITGGEISQLPDMVKGFDLVGTAVGLVPLDRILDGGALVPGDIVIGVESSGIHSNGFTLARHVLFERAKLSVDRILPELGCPLGEEMLRPTLIYVPEALEIISEAPGLKALTNITGDGLLNLPRVAARVGFEIDAPPPPPPIFDLIQRLGDVAEAEMYEVFNMGVGFCVLTAARDADAVLRILSRRGRRAWAIGRVVADDQKRVRLPRQRLIGEGKRFRRG
jgi:phosphoribosylformylglycinamidine cyclo-ligase